jgi:hypothetical protein
VKEWRCLLAVSIMTFTPNHAKDNLYRLTTRTDNGKVQMPLIMHECCQQFFKTAMLGRVGRAKLESMNGNEYSV